MQRFEENFTFSPQSPSWDQTSQGAGWPSHGYDVVEQKDKVDELSRSRSPTSVTLNDLDSPGLEAVVDSEKEVRHSAQIEAMIPVKRKRICGIKRPCFILALLVAACLIIAAGVSLGLTLGRQSDRFHQGPKGTPLSAPQSTPISNSPGINPEYYSVTGAFNGTGIALASQSFDDGGYGEIVMYFQHHSGQIRYEQLKKDGSWEGGSTSEILAENAKNATPITAVAYAMNETATWHLFYIDNDNTIRERINNNVTNLWSDGPFNDLNIKVMDSPNVGLQACWYGSFYGDAQYEHSPVPGQNETDQNNAGQSVGIRLWYGDTSTSFKEFGWAYGSSYWQPEDRAFEGYNGHAGVGCYTWGPGSVSYVFMANLNGGVDILWKDLNTSIKATPSHPVSTWTKSLTIPNTYPNTSLGYTNYLYTQMADLTISGYNISWAAENTSIVTSDSFTINGAKGIPGTHLSVTALPDESGGNSLLAFYQITGNDVTEFVRDFDDGQWTSSSILIPDS